MNPLRTQFRIRTSFTAGTLACLVFAGFFAACAKPGETATATASEEALPGSPRIVDGDGLRLRSRPNREGAIMGVLYRGDTVHELKRSAKPETIGGRQAHWVQIRTAEGTIGWVFGGFLKEVPGAATVAATPASQAATSDETPATTEAEPQTASETKTEAKTESQTETKEADANKAAGKPEPESKAAETPATKSETKAE